MSGYSGGDGAGKALVLFAVVPFVLVNFVLAAIFGDWVWKVTPILFVAMVTGLRVHRACRRQMRTGFTGSKDFCVNRPLELDSLQK